MKQPPPAKIESTPTVNWDDYLKRYYEKPTSFKSWSGFDLKEMYTPTDSPDETNDQNIADMIHSDLRRARAGAANIIPTTTGAAKAVGKVIPELNGKLDGFAMRVPFITGSVVDLVAELKKSVTAEQINDAIKAAAQGALKGILAYCDEPIVSSDIIGNSNSSIFDALSTMTLPKEGSNMVKVVSWYDNEWGYSSRTVDLMKMIAKM